MRYHIYIQRDVRIQQSNGRQWYDRIYCLKKWHVSRVEGLGAWRRGVLGG